MTFVPTYSIAGFGLGIFTVTSVVSHSLWLGYFIRAATSPHKSRGEEPGKVKQLMDEMVTSFREGLDPALPPGQRHRIPVPTQGLGLKEGRETVRTHLTAPMGKSVISSTGLKPSAPRESHFCLKYCTFALERIGSSHKLCILFQYHL